MQTFVADFTQPLGDASMGSETIALHRHDPWANVWHTLSTASITRPGGSYSNGRSDTWSGVAVQVYRNWISMLVVRSMQMFTLMAAQ
jgi:hypothetical protein